MINTFDDFCLYVYVIVDDLLQENTSLLKRNGPNPQVTDSELITMVLVAECRGWDVETELLSNFRERPNLFPKLPSQSRLNRRRRNLAQIINWLRRKLLARLDLALDNHCIIDSMPIPVVKFHLVPSSTGDWKKYRASFGQVPSKNQTIFGFKLHTLITMGGLILDFVLAPAHETDRNVGQELLERHSYKSVIGDKAYIDAERNARLFEQRAIQLLHLPRRNQKTQMSRSMKKLINSVRQMTETVNGQLVEQFSIEKNHAHSCEGLFTRLHSKLAAHTICVYINRLIGNSQWLQIKHLAYGN